MNWWLAAVMAWVVGGFFAPIYVVGNAAAFGAWASLAFVASLALYAVGMLVLGLQAEKH